MAADITEDYRPGNGGSAADDPEGEGVVSETGMAEREEAADDSETAENVATSERRRGVDEAAYAAEENGEPSPTPPASPGSRGGGGGGGALAAPAAPAAAADAAAAATPATAVPAAPTRRRDKKKRGKGERLEGNPAMSVEDLFVTISTVQVGT